MLNVYDLCPAVCWIFCALIRSINLARRMRGTRSRQRKVFDPRGTILAHTLGISYQTHYATIRTASVVCLELRKDDLENVSRQSHASPVYLRTFLAALPPYHLCSSQHKISSTSVVSNADFVIHSFAPIDLHPVGNKHKAPPGFLASRLCRSLQWPWDNTRNCLVSLGYFCSLSSF